MTKLSLFIRVSFWTILLFTASPGQEFKTVHDGVDYAEMSRLVDGVQVKMNLLRLDLTKVRLDVFHAKDAVLGLEKTSSIATRHGALAAINAGFFRIDRSIFEGDDVSTLMIDGKLLSESSNNRVALGIINGSKSTEVVFGHLRTGTSMSNDVNFIKLFDGIDRETKKDKNEILLYTPEFKKTPFTEAPTAQTILSGCKKSICKTVETYHSNGGTPIPADGYVVVSLKDITTDKNPVSIFSKLVPTDDGANPKLFERVEDIVSGVPQLIKDGKIDITWQEEKSSKSFVETKHPRTAVARLKDGRFLMVTIDGRSESSGGIGLQNLAELLLELGAVDAMNLDGGGSTTMVLDGKVVNHPSDKEGERSIGDAILVFERKK